MNLTILTKTLFENKRSLLWWSLGIFFYALINLLFYPDFKDQTEFNKLLESDALKAVVGNIESFTSPEGYLNSQMLSVSVPLFFIIFAVAQGTNAIAGEEGRRTLPLLLANPVSRLRIVYEKFAALKVGLLVLTVVQLITIAVIGPPFELSVDFWHLVAASFSLFLLAMLFGGLAFLIGAATGNRSLATGVTVAVAAASYLLNTLAPLVQSLEPYQKFSPFYLFYENDPLSNGLDWGHALVMIAVILLTFGLSLLVFRHRDVRA